MTPSDPTREALDALAYIVREFGETYLDDPAWEKVYAIFPDASQQPRHIASALEALAALPTTPAPSKEDDMEDEKTATTTGQDALDYAWTLIANASGGDWTRETQDWQAAAARFRDQYHATLDARRSTP